MVVSSNNLLKVISINIKQIVIQGVLYIQYIKNVWLHIQLLYINNL